MIILGIDPGYAIVGYGVVRYDNRTFTPVAYGAVTTEAGLEPDLRLEQVYDGICTIIDRYQPEAIAIEPALFHQQQDHRHHGGPGPWGDPAGRPEKRRSHLRVHPHAGQAVGGGIRQGGQKAGDGDDPHHAAAGEDPQAGRCRRCPGHCHLPWLRSACSAMGGSRLEEAIARSDAREARRMAENRAEKAGTEDKRLCTIHSEEHSLQPMAALQRWNAAVWDTCVRCHPRPTPSFRSWGGGAALHPSFVRRGCHWSSTASPPRPSAAASGCSPRSAVWGPRWPSPSSRR